MSNPAPSTAEQEAAHKTLLAAGNAMRSQVLGSIHTPSSTSSSLDSFTDPMRELVTAHCWGTIWPRPGLPLKTRSLLNIAMLAVLGRSHEMGVHVRGAIRNGCTKEEIQEVLLQVATYGGMPAGVEGFRVAEGVLRTLEAEENENKKVD